VGTPAHLCTQYHTKEIQMTKRRGNHEGSIQKRPDGSWRVQIRLNGRRLSFSAKTRQECQVWQKKTIAQIDNGLSFAGAQTTLAEFLEGWLISIKSTLRSTTWYQYNMTSLLNIKLYYYLIRFG
jgi:hypothetical protein